MATLFRSLFVRRLAAAAAMAIAATIPSVALGQTPTGGLRGYVRDEAGQPLSGAQIQARNLGTNLTRSATTDDKGFYALLGLEPADYEVTVRRIGGQPQTRQVHVGVGAVSDQTFQLATATVQVQALTVTAEAPAETRSATEATNVSQAQIQNLPNSQRNFLDLAALAPGVVLQGTGIDATTRTISYGAQGPEQINVFIDGATYKNDMILGGVVGQNTSRGNPFPLSAIQEYRVLTQNYKAEYQRASSAVITAATRSGTNTWQGHAFYSYQNKGLVSLSQFQRSAALQDTAFRKPDYTRDLFGLDVGGPLIHDRLFFFGSYEGNIQNRTSQVSIPAPPAGYTALDTFNFQKMNGFYGSPFRQQLFFGKVNYVPSDRSNFELGVNTRSEYDIRNFGGMTAYSAATRFNDAVTTVTGRHTYTPGGNWMNEATVSWQRYRYNPVPNSAQPYNLFFGFGCCVNTNSDISIQDFTQSRLSLRNDLTYTGFRAVPGNHVMKFGANVDFANYDEIKRNSEIPRFVYELWHDSARTPERVEFQAGNPNFKTNNTQLGLYAQDDWSPTERLTFNLGVRWDYESGMLNRSYVTPSAVHDTLVKYADSLFIPLDTSRYFSNGHNRKPYLGGFQPRLGVTYALDQAARTTLFGGWGIFQDRDLFDFTTEEAFAQQHPAYTVHFRPAGDTTSGRVDWNNSYFQGASAVDPLAALSNTQEIKLLPNDLRPPTSQQFTVGIRQLIGTWSAEVSYNGVRSSNGFTFYWANQNFTCAGHSFAIPGCFANRRVPGYGSVLLAQNAGKTWYDALNVKLERPFTVAEHDLSWGAGLAYTYAQRQTAGFNDEFSFPNGAYYPRQVRNDERHHIVANWILQSQRLWGVQFGGVLTWGSGQRYDVGDRFGCPNPAPLNGSNQPVCNPPNPLLPGAFQAPPYTNLDLRLHKQFFMGRNAVGVAVDLFNAFNNQNLGCFNVGSPYQGTGAATYAPSPNFGAAGCTISDPQRLQVGMDVGF